MSTATLSKIRVRRLGAAMGAEVTGIDLSEEMDDEDFACLREAFTEHLALFFPGQQLKPADISRFLGRFGELVVYPYLPAIDGDPHVHELRKTPEASSNFGGVWHQDAPFLARPVMVNLLYSRQLPTTGGDTLFLNGYAAYDALSEGMKTLIAPLRIVHTIVDKYLSDVAVVNQGSTAVLRTEAVHPVVRVHPSSGRRHLYLGGIFAQRLEGLTPEESRPLIDFLLAHAQRPEFQFRHHWSPDMLGIWDNRCTMHYALNDYPGQTRVMHRALVWEPA